MFNDSFVTTDFVIEGAPADEDLVRLVAEAIERKLEKQIFELCSPFRALSESPFINSTKSPFVNLHCAS